MTIPFKAISMSYKNVPLEIRERFALNSYDRHRLLHYAKQTGGIEEMVIVSTCNRFEVYFVSDIVSCRQLISLLQLFVPFPNVSHFVDLFRLYDRQERAVEHLFRVAIGLESQVLGDLQMINQVKSAYQESVDADMAGPFVHRLLHAIFHTHKIVTQKSCFKDCHASVPQVVKNLAQQLVPQSSAVVLILGTGKMGRGLSRKLSKIGYEVWVSNRTEEKSLALAAELGLKSIPLNDVHLSLGEVQLVISALTVGTPILTKSRIKSADFDSHKILIDLSVPRSIDPELVSDPNITLLNMEDVNDEISSTIQKRKSQVPKVEAIIKREVSEFLEWAHEMKILPTIHQMKAALEKIRKEEISRQLKKTDFKDHELIHYITKSIVDKVVKLPALKLRLACKRGDDENMVQVLNEIFNI